MPWSRRASMKSFLLRHSRSPQLADLKRFFFLMRGLLMFGHRYKCPCCGWRLRAFVGERSIFRKSETGYCPRCNAKARHRRIWLYLQEHTKLFSERTRLLEIAPWWSLARRFQKMNNIEFVGVDLKPTGPQVTTIGDLVSLPIKTGKIDTAICIHVLEHIDDDHKAIAELHRVLRSGGLAIISVPLRLDRVTHEDPAIQDPDERAVVFGEPGHVRYYGIDLLDRLRQPGFDVSMDLADNVPAETRHRYGLRDDENIFHCVKRSQKSREPAA